MKGKGVASQPISEKGGRTSQVKASLREVRR